MNRFLLLLLVAAGGFAGGALSHFLLPAAPAGPVATAPVLPESPAVPEEAGRVARLEGEVAALRAALNSLELSVLERREVAAADAPGSSSDPQRHPASTEPDGFVPDGFLDDRIGAVLEERERAREMDRQARWQAAREQRLARQVERLSEALGLDDYQAGEMSRILQEADDARLETFTAMRESGDFDRVAVRESMRAIRAESIEALQLVLTPQQLEQYESMQDDFGGFGRPPVRGPGPRPGGEGGF